MGNLSTSVVGSLQFKCKPSYRCLIDCFKLTASKDKDTETKILRIYFVRTASVKCCILGDSCNHIRTTVFA